MPADHLLLQLLSHQRSAELHGAADQAHIGLRTLPRTLADVLALTIVVEWRWLARYAGHAARASVDAATRAVVQTVAADEHWHLAWFGEKLDAMTAADPPAQERVRCSMERYRRIAQEVYADLLAMESAAFGGEVSHAPADPLR